MIEIDFKIDEDVLEEDLEEDITKYSIVTFVVTMFIMPVRMQVKGIELFEHKNDPWDVAPLMNIASNGLLSVKKLKLMKEVSYEIIEGPGEFKFSMIDETNVSLDLFNGSRHFLMVVNYDELLEAFQKFAEKVRDFLKERAPQMYKHPYWGPWLSGERD